MNASAIPWDCGPLTGVEHGINPMLRATAQVPVRCSSGIRSAPNAISTTLAPGSPAATLALAPARPSTPAYFHAQNYRHRTMKYFFFQLSIGI